MSRIGGAPAAGLFQDMLLAILLIVCTVVAGALWAIAIVLRAVRGALGMISGRPGDYSLLWWSAVMACAFAAGVLALTPPAQAQTTVGAHIASWHSEPGFNNSNPGLYLRTSDGWTLGGYRNSVRRDSAYAGWTGGVQVAEGLRAEVTVGVISGYLMDPVLPLLAPSLRIGADTGPAVRLTFLPRVHAKQGAHVAHLSTEWSF